MKLARLSFVAVVSIMSVAVAWAAEGPPPERLIDNESFRLLKITWPPGMHQAELHPPPTKATIATALTSGEIEVNFRQNGKTWTEKGHVDVGKVWYLPKTLEHQFTNIGDKPFVLTSLQLK